MIDYELLLADARIRIEQPVPRFKNEAENEYQLRSRIWREHKIKFYEAVKRQFKGLNGAAFCGQEKSNI